MQTNSLRQELKDLLAGLETARPPVLRRSRREEWLYASDLPGVCGGETLEAALRALDGHGWRWRIEEGWIQLGKTTEEPPEGWYAGGFPREARCCRSLLERQAERTGEGAEKARILLIKAGERGEAAYGEACGQLHRAWAARLREGRKLPEISTAYFGRTGEGG